MLRGGFWLVLFAVACERPPQYTEVLVVAGADSGTCWPFAKEPSSACAGVGDAEAPSVVAASEPTPAREPEPGDPAGSMVDDAPATSAAPGCAPFDRGAAARALGAMNLAGCANGQSGRGHFKVVFAPDGGAKAYTIDPPFAGTPAGSCIASRVRGLRIPPFCGAPVTVGKSFTLP